jgi:hypothetical protein
MKYIVLSFLLGNIFSLFAMQLPEICLNTSSLKKIKIAPIDEIKKNLKDQSLYPIAETFAGKEMFPMQIVMEIQRFYNDENDLQKKSVLLRKNTLILMHAFIAEDNKTTQHFKDELFN